MATSIDFKALYAEARRAAAAAKQQQGAVSQVQEPSNEITNRSWNDHDTGHVVEEIEDECVHLTPSGELAVDAFAPFRVGDVPAVYYLPNFISDAEEQRLLYAVRLASTLTLTLPLHILFISLPTTRSTANPRLGGQASSVGACRCGVRLRPSPVYHLVSRWCAVRAGGKPSAAGMAQEELPSWLGELSQLLKEKKVFKKDFNHVLINEYEPGQGIMVPPLSSHVWHGGACSLTRDHACQAHEDGPLYISHVAILSLQSALMMEIYEKPFADKKKLFSLYLEPRNYPSSSSSTLQLEAAPTSCSPHLTSPLDRFQEACSYSGKTSTSDTSTPSKSE